MAGEVVRALTVRIRKRRYSPVRGLPSSKTTMLADRIAALDVADVVALDTLRWRRQTERLGELLEGARVLPWSASQRACSRASVSVAFRVASAQQLPLLAALRVRRWTGPPRCSVRNVSRSLASGSTHRQEDLTRYRRGPAW